MDNDMVSIHAYPSVIVFTCVAAHDSTREFALSPGTPDSATACLPLVGY